MRLSIVFIQFIGEPGNLARGPFAGLALANASTTLVEALALWWLLRRRIGERGTVRGINDGHIIGGAVRALLASLGMGAVMWVVARAMSDVQGIVVAIVAVAVGGVVFFGLSLALGLDEAKAVPQMVLRRIRR